MRTRSKAGLLGVATLLAAAAWADDFKVIFDGKTPEGWVTNNDSKPLKKECIQPDGLNPHGSGGYIVMYEAQARDFVLDFDYKLSKGCNSGVFIRVADPKDPVYTGLEIALDDSTGTGLHDPGAFYDLVATKVNAQKPAGEWNHMTVTAKDADIEVEINGQSVSKIDLNRFPKAGTRPDGSKHKFANAVIKDFDRAGYLGFQDHGQDCWYKNVKLKVTE